MKKQSILIIVIAVLAIAAFAEVIFIVSRNADIVASNGNNTETTETDKVVTEITTTAPREPEDDFSYTAPPGYETHIYLNPDYNTDQPTDFSDSGKVIKIYSNDDLYEIETFQYYPGLPNDTEIQQERINQDDYNDYLIELLKNNETAEADEKIDLFLLEPEYAAEFLNSDYVIPLSELGITEAELSDQFEYAKDIASDDNGIQKGFMYKLYPEVFVYRRSIATAVLGTDDPAKIAEYVKDLETFEKTAETMKNSGYYMLGSYEDIYKTFLGNGRMENVYEDGKLIVPTSWKEWADKTKSYIEKGYIVPNFRFTEGWNEAMNNETVFGHIGNSEYLESLLTYYPDDWALCPAPVPTYSSGVIVCVAKGTDNPEIAAEIVRSLVLDEDALKSIALDDKVLTNNYNAMGDFLDEEGAAEFLIGIDTMAVYSSTAHNIKNAKSNYSINSNIFDFYAYYVSSYLTGNATYDEALQGYFENVPENYPEVPKTIAQIEAEQDLERHAITSFYNAEKGATREELDEAKRILLSRLESLGFEGSKCYIDYTTGEI
jgi:hypothetical protein